MHRGARQGTPLAAWASHPVPRAKGSIVIEDQRSEDIRALFDWRNAPHDGGQAAGAPVANDDLALALRLLSCNPRDREQFRGGPAAA